MDKLSNPKRTQAEFILDQVIRTGYPLEMEISSLLEEDDWIVFNNDFYLVEDETGKRIDKEIDIRAMYPPRLTIDKSVKPFFPRFDLIVECKKSTEYAWVFFVRPLRLRGGFRYFLSGQYYDFLEMFTKDNESLEICYKTGLHYNDFELGARTYAEVKHAKKTGATRTTQILSGINQLIGFIDYLHLAEKILLTSAKTHSKDIFFNFAVIVFDGELYEANMKSGKPKLVKSDHILFQVQRHSKYHGVKSFSIDIVSKKYFPDYLKIIKNDIALMKNEISSSRDVLKRNSDKIFGKYRRKALLRRILRNIPGGGIIKYGSEKE